MRGRACAGLPREIFYPADGQKYDKAASVCARCPVIDRCERYYLDDEGRCYVAGMTQDERAQKRKSLRKEAS